MTLNCAADPKLRGSGTSGSAERSGFLTPVSEAQLKELGIGVKS